MLFPKGMIFMKAKYLPFVLITLAVKSAMAQNNVDSFINTLHNQDVRSELAFVAPKKTFDSGKVYAHTVERVLTSANLGQIRKAFPKYLLVQKLVEALNDPERDWYADLLLYDLTLVPAFNIFGCDTRDKWLTIDREGIFTYKEEDMQFWRIYLVGLSPSDKY
jgi:hypothetical protein